MILLIQMNCYTHADKIILKYQKGEQSDASDFTKNTLLKVIFQGF